MGIETDLPQLVNFATKDPGPDDRCLSIPLLLLVNALGLFDKEWAQQLEQDLRNQVVSTEIDKPEIRYRNRYRGNHYWGEWKAGRGHDYRDPSEWK